MNNVTDVHFLNEQIWVSTSGGAYVFDISDSTAQKFTNVDGLESMSLNSATNDDKGHILFYKHRYNFDL